MKLSQLKGYSEVWPKQVKNLDEDFKDGWNMSNECCSQISVEVDVEELAKELYRQYLGFEPHAGLDESWRVQLKKTKEKYLKQAKSLSEQMGK